MQDKPYAVEIEEDDDFPELRARIAVMMDYSPDKTGEFSYVGLAALFYPLELVLILTFYKLL